MLTVPTAFEKSMYRQIDATFPVVILKDSSDTTLATVSPIGRSLKSVSFYPLLKSISRINENLNIFTKTHSVADVTIKLHNIKLGFSSNGSKLKATDISNLLSEVASLEIYLCAGHNATSTSDMLLRFRGVILQSPSYDSDEITIKAVSWSRKYHRLLPLNIMGDTFTDSPPETENQKIPLAYGSFTIVGNGSDEEFDGSGTGLAKGIKANINDVPSFLFGDHVSYSFSSIWLDPSDAGVTEPGLFYSNTLETDNSGYTTGSGHAKVYTWVHACHNDDENYLVTTSMTPWTNAEKAYDRDVSTYATAIDNVDTGTYQYPEACFGLNEWPLAEFFYEIRPQVYWHNISGIGVGWSGYLVDIENYTAIASFNTSNSSSGFSWSESTASLATQINASSSTPTGIHLYFGHTSGQKDADSVADNSSLAYVAAMRVECLIKPQEQNVAWGELEGREYGSWIDSRSSSYSSGDLIDDPAGIIESLLRDELGVTSSYIDEDSFDNAENASIEARINIHSDNEKTSEDTIQQLSEQSTFAFVWTASGLCKLISMKSSDWSSPSVNKTIPLSWIKDGKIGVSKTPVFANKISIKSRYQQEYGGIFRDTDTAEDSTSQTNYQVRSWSGSWENVCGATVDTLKAYYVNSTNGLWSKEHVQITIETLGYTCADLELGDCIQLDSDSIDPYLKAYGSSWSGIYLCVTKISQGDNSTKIVATELF